MTNDRVTVNIEKERDGRFKGEIIRIIDHSQKKIAGRFMIVNEQYGVIKDEGKGWGSDLRVSISESMNAKSNQLVSAEILTYPDTDSTNKSLFTGKVIEIIGDPDSALNDIKRVIINQGIPDKFSAATIEEASQFSKNPEEKDFKNRKDLRHLPIITIDGATAKDFDDAVYVEMTDKGFHLYVAIADVSHYVKAGSSMDKEAYERGTSVYFPNFVVPMLPEALSNGLCSLNPNVPRLALVSEMYFDFTGQMMNYQFFEAVIESKARVTYGEAQEIIDGNDIEKFSHVKENILKCADLAKILMAKRFKEGSLDLEVPETELVIDGTGEPIDVIKSERLFAHRLIEEMMLAANISVAKFLSGKEVPSLYRTHEAPDPMKISLLQKFVGQLGSKVKFSGAKLQKQLTKALQEFHNKPQASVIHILTLRSMSQAKYTAENIGHFGLGFDYYSHFTSPIRRYPDLIIHRLVKNQIGVPGYRLLAEDEVQSAGTWLSACEQRSAKSERQIQSIKKARFMSKMLGESFEGMVSSVTKFGLFVLLKQYNIDGLIRLEDLGTHHSWFFDEENLKLVSKKSGFSYNIGDMIKVIVSQADVQQGQINFTLEKSAKDTVNQPKTGLQQKNKKDFKHEKPNHKTKKSNPNKKAAAEPKKSLRLRALEHIEQRENKDYQINPKYSSLSDYLDKNKDKNKDNKSFERTEKPYGKKTNDKSNNKSSQDRSNSEKRGKTEGYFGRFSKTRPKKSGSKNKSR